MKLFAPEYYKKFKCIADKCRHSCCVGWEIDVDGETLEKYGRLPEKSRKSILDTIEISDGTASFRLTEGERCPHLSERGLCNIITRHGEDFLCEICREHPRFYNVCGQRAEVGIGAVCEVAAELILGCENYADTVPAGEICADIFECEFDSVSERKRVYKILGRADIPYSEKLVLIRKNYSVATLARDELCELLSSLEYLREEDRELFVRAVSWGACEIKNETERERALAYFIYRHGGAAETESEFSVALSLSLLLLELFSSLCARGDFDAASALRLVSEEIEYSEENIERIKIAIA